MKTEAEHYLHKVRRRLSHDLPRWSERRRSSHRPTWCRPAQGSWEGRSTPCLPFLHLNKATGRFKIYCRSDLGYVSTATSNDDVALRGDSVCRLWSRHCSVCLMRVCNNYSGHTGCTGHWTISDEVQHAGYGSVIMSVFVLVISQSLKESRFNLYTFKPASLRYKLLLTLKLKFNDNVIQACERQTDGH